MSNQIKRITRLAIVASMYVVLTVAIAPIAYSNLQFRISEILVLLCFYRKDYSISLIVGCFISNLFSPMPLDIVFGTLATALAVLGISYSKNLFIATLFPVILNGIIIGLQLHFFLDLPLVESMISVAVGEAAVVSIVGYFVFRILQKNKGFIELIDANQNLDF